MIRRPPRSTLDRSSAASDVYKRQIHDFEVAFHGRTSEDVGAVLETGEFGMSRETGEGLSLIHISEPTRPY